MAANVETMFYVREVPWHGLGVRVAEAPNSREALEVAGLNWSVVQKSIMTEDNVPVKGYKVNIRDMDNAVLGVVTDRYKVVQNTEAFAFTDALLGEGVTYESAGSLQNGRKTWLLARLPEKYQLAGEEVTPFLVFSNSHDGSGAIKVAMTPVRVVCQNTLNLALSTASRIWSTVHLGALEQKMNDARNTLFLADTYMHALDAEVSKLRSISLSDEKVMNYIDMLLPMGDNPTRIHEKNIRRIREDLKMRYFDAPDLQDVGKNGYRFINAVSDFATHASPLRATVNYRENIFGKTIEGNPLIDKAYSIVLSAA